MPDFLAYGVHEADDTLRRRRKTAPARARAFLAQNGPSSARKTMARSQIGGELTGMIAGFTAGHRLGNPAADALKKYTGMSAKTAKRFRVRSGSRIAGAVIGAHALGHVGSRLGAKYGRHRIRVAESKKPRTFKFRIARLGTASAARMTGGTLGAALGTATMGPGPGTLAGLVGGAATGHLAAHKAYTPEVHAYMAKDWKKTKERHIARRTARRRFMRRHNIGSTLYEQGMTTKTTTNKPQPVKYNPRVTVATRVPKVREKPMTVVGALDRLDPMGTRDLPYARKQTQSAKSRQQMAVKSANRQERGKALANTTMTADVNALDDLFERAKDVEAKVVDLLAKHGERHVENPGPPIIGKVVGNMARKTGRAAERLGATAGDFADKIEQGAKKNRTSRHTEARRRVRNRVRRGARKVWYELNKERPYPTLRRRVHEDAALVAFQQAWRLGKKTLKYAQEKASDTKDSSVRKTRRVLTRLEKLPKPTRRYKRMGSHLDSSIGKSDRYKGLSRREKDRIKYGVMRKQGWKPKRERKYQVAVGG
jgi:uncharacterized protein YcfJ